MIARRYIDHRGREMRVPPPDATSGAGLESGRDAMLQRARAALHGVPSGIFKRLAQATLAGCAVAGVIYFRASPSFSQTDRLGVVVIAGIIGSLVAWGVMRLTDKVPPIADVPQLLAGCQLCIVCGYDLSGQPSEADGCTLCPECGCALRLQRPER